MSGRWAKWSGCGYLPRVFHRYSYFVSAKNGDHVNSTFYRIAADLAGIVLTKSELESNTKVVRAEIINHPVHRAFPPLALFAANLLTPVPAPRQQHDAGTEKLVLPRNEAKCSIQ